MKKIGVVANGEKDIGFIHTRITVEKLLEKGFKPYITKEVNDVVNLPAEVSDSVYKDSDLIICIGGDGTFLNAARQAYDYKKPVLGINKGTVGFLAEVEVKDIEKAITQISEGDFHIQPRMVLNVEVFRQGEKVYEDIAINDAVVSRIALSRIVRLKVTLDEKYVDTFPGDGIIISTPTGSTGYSLSAGGPIIQPDMRLFLISPICPHTLYSRSFIAPDTRTVKVCLDDISERNAMLTIDGQHGFELEPGDLVCVKASKKDALFASVSHVNFYDVLRAKIHS